MSRVNIILVSVFSVSIFLYAEPSVYGLGNSVQNKNQMGKVKKSMLQLEQKVLAQEEKIEGLSTLIEGLVNAINLLKQEQSSKTLELKVNMIVKTYLRKQNFIKSELDTFVKVKNKIKPISKTVVIKEDKTLINKPTSILYKEGVKLFTKRRFSEAKKRFLLTDNKGYKVAPSNYYLGEIAYYTKSYNDAIFYFKKSSGLYENASYMGTLVFHTAISLEKSGKKEQAKLFYENVISTYVGKKVAKMAQDRLDKL